MPLYVVLNGWLRTNILPPYQIERMKHLLSDAGGKVCHAERAFQGSYFESERVVRENLQRNAQKEGQKWLNNLASELSDDEEMNIDVHSFDEEHVRESCRGLHDLAAMDQLQGCDDIEAISEEELNSFTSEVYKIPVCRPMDEHTAVEGAISEALQDFEDENRAHVAVKKGTEDGQTSECREDEPPSAEKRPTLAQFDESLFSLQENVRLLKQNCSMTVWYGG